MKSSPILIDTNFILRFFLADIPKQYKASKKFFKSVETGKYQAIISLSVINELIWILENYYEKKRADFIENIITLLALKNIKILEIKKSDLIAILKLMLEKSLDFTDLYLAFLVKKTNSKIESFDKKLNKLIP